MDCISDIGNLFHVRPSRFQDMLEHCAEVKALSPAWLAMLQSFDIESRKTFKGRCSLGDTLAAHPLIGSPLSNTVCLTPQMIYLKSMACSDDRFGLWNASRHGRSETVLSFRWLSLKSEFLSFSLRARNCGLDSIG
jgi:hypothetical protein